MFPILVLTLSVHQAFGGQVSETWAEYQCPEMALEYDVVAGLADNNKTQCRQFWSLNKRTFATYADGEAGCHEPCIMVYPGNIRLRTCVNVTLTVLCRLQQYLEESRIYFTGRVHQSPVAITTGLPHQEGTRNRYYGFLVAAVVFLLSVAISGFVWKALNRRTTSSTVVQL